MSRFLRTASRGFLQSSSNYKYSSNLLLRNNNNNCRRAFHASCLTAGSGGGATPSAATAPTTTSFRLSKLLATHANNLTMSRREAERLIREGSVTLAGSAVTSPTLMVEGKAVRNGALKVNGKAVVFETDKNGRILSPDSSSSLNSKTKTRVWLVHKLKGEVVAEYDPQGRPCLLQRLVRGGVGKSKKKHKANVHLKPIGRLDMSTEGLIVVTNNGQYARDMELPKHQIHRTYRVRAHGILSRSKLTRIRHGIRIEGLRYAPMKVEIDETKRKRLLKFATNTWLRVTCAEGKNRMIRNVFEHLGLNVTRLIRVSFGDYELGTIPPSMAVEVPCQPLHKHGRRGPLANYKRHMNSAMFRDRRRRPKPSGQEKDAAKPSPVQWIHNP